MAAKILTQDRLKELLHYDPATGIFTWLRPCNRFSQVKPGDFAGALHKRGYIHIKVEGRCYKAHRLAWLYVYGRWPAPAIDHINRDKKDNRLTNLREVTHLKNMQNKSIYRQNVSGRPGVTPHRNTGRWVAQVQVNHRNHYLGIFDTPELAANAYHEARRRLLA